MKATTPQETLDLPFINTVDFYPWPALFLSSLCRGRMSSQQPERYIILDDEDPSITYSGPGWFQDEGQDNVGVLGPPYLNTLHGTSEDGSLSLQFNGMDLHDTVS